VDTDSKLEELIKEYNTVVKVIDRKGRESTDRAYGGVVRMAKGGLQEYLTEEIVKLAWESIGGNQSSLDINSAKVAIPIQDSYIADIADEEIRKHIQEYKVKYKYMLSVDKHVFINKKFVIAIECKAYTENAMMKRILTDFMLLKTKYPELKTFLFQLESQLGGDYSKLNPVTFGSHTTHTLASYFPSVDLKIVTLLRGERRIDEPIHREEYFKPLEKKQLSRALSIMQDTMASFLKT
jgi:hypothetical protein